MPPAARFQAFALAVLVVIGISCGGPAWGEPAAMTDDGNIEIATTGGAPLEEALRRHLTALSTDIGERSPWRGDGLARAEAYIRATWDKAGLRVTEQVYDYRGRRVANLIAEAAGARQDGPFYVVGAHYDTVPGTPGADDNASGVAVLLELGRRVAAAPPRLPLRLVAFTLEEPPAFNTRDQGSRVFVRRLAEAGEQALGAIVLEMVGFTAPSQTYPFFLRWAGYPSHGRFIAVVGNRSSRRFGHAILRGFRGNPRLPAESLFVPLDGWILPDTRLSDHASFWDAGWPAVMVTDTAFFRNPHYHGPSDRAETLDFSFMAELVRSLENALAELAVLD